MTQLEEIMQCTNIHRIPKYIHVNKGILFDYRLFDALVNPEHESVVRYRKYDFDVYLHKYGINLQRPYVWEPFQQREFIMSLLLEKPIDDFVVIQYINDYKDRDDVTVHIIDGKQRLMTIQKFGNNEFPIQINGRDIYYKDFDKDTKMFFQSRVDYLTATVYYSYPDCLVDDDMKIILFNYYNFAGTPQTEEHKEKLQNLLKL